MTLAELTQEEERLQAVRSSVVGLIEEKHDQLEGLGAFGDYRRVHSGYARLGLAGDLEALKRALFIQWYAVAEPAFLSAIHTLDESAERNVLAEVERQLPEVGQEMRSMVAWALAVADWYFERFGCLESFRASVGASDKERLWTTNPAKFEGRGQMGEYFSDIVTSAHARGYRPGRWFTQ
jgi:hypothetical protein